MRIDVYLFNNGYTKSREEAQKLIKLGCVKINGEKARKPSFAIDGECSIEIENPFAYVSRGGDKLRAALDTFGVSVSGRCCVDIGASTGGFTDCLLQHGASKVFAIDSGTGQLAESLKSSPRVVSMENVNARYLRASDIPEKCTLCVMDVSFISQTLIYSAVADILQDGGEFISLVKPQFEAGRGNVGKGGIVKDEKIRQRVLENIIQQAELYGLRYVSHITSPIKGGDGNTEYLAYFIKQNGC